MKELVTKIKENYTRWMKLKNIQSRADVVWESLKEHHKENGYNHSINEKEKSIECMFGIDEKNKIIKFIIET